MFCTITTQRSQFYGHLQHSLLNDYLQQCLRTSPQIRYSLSTQYSALQLFLIQSGYLKSCPIVAAKFFCPFMQRFLGRSAALRSIRMFRTFAVQLSSSQSLPANFMAIPCETRNFLPSKMLPTFSQACGVTICLSLEYFSKRHYVAHFLNTLHIY